jgi:alpha-glucosidase (family GH31 glycosyl hydrolase)
VAYKDVDTKAKAKKLVELRYQMLPYNYTLAFENSQKGTPLMRPLLFEEPQNSALWNTTSTYLWGPNFLVTPITQPNTKTTTVYFPKANSWYDWYSNERIAGGTQQEVTVADDHLPVYVRGGSFIPMINTIQTTRDYSLSQLFVHYYHDEATPTSSGSVYNDDGKTPNSFATGVYEILHFSQTTSADLLEIKLSTETGKSFVSAPKKLNLILHQFTKTVSQVTANGKSIPFVRSKDQSQLIIPLTDFKNPFTLQIR